jgi:FdhE protein
MVRITCSHCLNNEGIAYHSIEGGAEAIRVLWQVPHLPQDPLSGKRPSGEPVADDLASLALDLPMTQEDYHRGSGNPLLWQHTDS